ncbi:hypothetical protein CEXT_367561 [Caerostris extrusa]|uniref:Uncharacterized protein n=1 Tax=Caerostris extrusa TaxID=172846 RepID=A0AAV4WJ00_CAEEX|nr:hypothetical protein CEXT_367561 [Caerostris extrusa]
MPAILEMEGSADETRAQSQLASKRIQKRVCTESIPEASEEQSTYRELDLIIDLSPISDVMQDLDDTRRCCTRSSEVKVSAQILGEADCNLQNKVPFPGICLHRSRGKGICETFFRGKLNFRKRKRNAEKTGVFLPEEKKREKEKEREFAKHSSEETAFPEKRKCNAEKTGVFPSPKRKERKKKKKILFFFFLLGAAFQGKFDFALVESKVKLEEKSNSVLNNQHNLRSRSLSIHPERLRKYKTALRRKFEVNEMKSTDFGLLSREMKEIYLSALNSPGNAFKKQQLQLPE